MKKIILGVSLILIVFLVGCTKQIDRTAPSPGGKPPFPPGFEAPTTTIKLEAGTYKLMVGEEINYNNHKIKVTRVDSGKGWVYLNIDGSEYLFERTKLAQVFDDVQVQTLKIYFGETPEQYSADVKVEPFSLGENEYYLFTTQEVRKGKYLITFKDITKFGALVIRVNTDDINVDLGKTVTYENLEITNVKIYDASQVYKKSAIIKIVEKQA